MNAELRISGSAEESAQKCADFIMRGLSDSVTKAGRATLAISGGSTPRPMFADLAKAKFDWSKVHIFFVDERCVPPTDSQSNFKMANEAWLSPGAVPAGNIHRIYGELPPEEGASRYLAEIKAFFAPRDGELPVFDILHRGMGPDCHTASLFPGEPLIANRTGIAAHVWVEKMKMDRVTLLPGVLLAARKTVLQVAGTDKADALHDVVTGPEDWFRYPCQIASRDERAIWFLDSAAAAKLP